MSLALLDPGALVPIRYLSEFAAEFLWPKVRRKNTDIYFSFLLKNHICFKYFKFRTVITSAPPADITRSINLLTFLLAYLFYDVQRMVTDGRWAEKSFSFVT